MSLLFYFTVLGDHTSGISAVRMFIRKPASVWPEYDATVRENSLYTVK